ncbi:hypothetical protein [Mycolicibacterium bacteremicum]|uniref:hypothetical protein n=1 Tax=Mycolicibacterium bacteremicum TaxID=564198 RepID=UPI0026F1E977|nr:hypothetical protein [Mycolicibacterium bacteremicum]
MGRRNRARRDQNRPSPALHTRRVEIGPDGVDHEVRSVPASRADKTYRCPGCDHEIRPGVAHIVAIPLDDVEDRRHWHTSCWTNRSRRGPTRRWS